MIAQALYLLALYGIGLSLVARHARELGPVLTAGVAAPVGIASFALVQLGLALFNIKLVPLTLWLAVAAILVLAAIVGLRRGVGGKRELALAGAIAVILVAGVAALQSSLSFAVLAYDSYDYVVLGSNLYRGDTSLSSPAMSGFLNNYAPLLWLAHAPARLLGLDFLTILHPLIFGALLLTSCGLVEVTTRRVRLPLLARAPLSVAPALVLLTTPQFLHHGVYVMPNMLTALLLTASVACLWVADVQKAGNLTIAAAICLSGIALARQEGGLICAALVVLFSTAENVSATVKTAVGVFVALVATAWYAALIAFTGPAGEGAILTPMVAMMQVGALWIAAAACLAFTLGALRPFVRLGAMSLPFVLLLAYVAYFVIKPAHAAESMGVFVVNAIWPASLWGAWWAGALAIGALALALPPRLPFNRMLSVTAASILLLVALLGIVRHLPFRLGDQDSGNRMLIHVFPLLWAYLAAHFGAQFGERQPNLAAAVTTS